MYEKPRTTRRLKVLTAFLLALVLLFCTLSPLTALAAKPKKIRDFTRYPTVRLAGAKWALWNYYGTDQQYKIYTDKVPVKDGYIKAQAKVLIPKLMKAVVTNDYTDYANGLVDAVAGVYADFVPDENGDPRNGSGRETTQATEDKKKEDGTYDLSDYFFNNDWRLSPLVQADKFKVFVDQVLAVTGAKKINLYARCESSSVVLAYLKKYGCGKVASLLVDSYGSNGYLLVSYAFSGEVEMTRDMVYRWTNCYINNGVYDGPTNDYKIFDDTYTAELIKASLNVLTTGYSGEALIRILMKIYEAVKDIALPGILMNSYGRLLSYWSMVDVEHYEKARALLLSDPKWDTFRARADDYFYNVQCKTEEILDDCEAHGVKIQVISKYGYEVLPVIQGHTFLSDGEVAVKDSSFGATCAPNGEVFSKEYLDAAKAAGTDGYISADKKIDASTCRYPDQTWFVKNCSHNNIHTITRTLQLAFLRSGGTLTIHDDVTLPQYFFCDEGMGTYGPLTEDNAPYTEMFDYMGPIRARLNFAKALFQFIGHRLKLAFEAAGDTLKKK